MKYEVDARKDPYCNVSGIFELPRPPDVEQAPLNSEVKETGESLDRAKTYPSVAGTGKLMSDSERREQVRLMQSWKMVCLTDAFDAELEEIERRDMANGDVDVTPFFACMG